MSFFHPRSLNAWILNKRELLKGRRRKTKDLRKQQLFRKTTNCVRKQQAQSVCMYEGIQLLGCVLPRIKVQLVQPSLSTGKWGEATPNRRQNGMQCCRSAALQLYCLCSSGLGCVLSFRTTGSFSDCAWLHATGSWSQGSASLTPNPLSPQNYL